MKVNIRFQNHDGAALGWWNEWEGVIPQQLDFVYDEHFGYKIVSARKISHLDSSSIIIVLDDCCGLDNGQP